MKATRLLTAAAVAALFPLAGAFAQSSPEQGATFESLDTDSDGRISKTEAAANQNVLDQFSRYDKDGNGFIERAEVTSTNQSSSSPDSQPQK